MFVSLRLLVRTPRPVMLALLALGLSGCSTLDDATRGMADALTFYKPEVVQGNFIASEQVALLQAGMSRLQVRDVLGTPLMASLFHGDRWDYVFTLKRQRTEPQRYRLTVFFHDDVLDRFEGDDMPSETEFVQRISRERKVKVPVLQATDEQLAKFPTTSAPTERADETVSPPPNGHYPPLETAR